MDRLHNKQVIYTHVKFQLETRLKMIGMFQYCKPFLVAAAPPPPPPKKKNNKKQNQG
jgi:hypothetical protein